MRGLVTKLKRNGISFYILLGLNLAFIPFVAQNLSPEQLSSWYLWFNLITFIMTLGTFRYELSINIAEDDKEAFISLFQSICFQMANLIH